MAFANGRIPVAFLVPAMNAVAPGQVLEAQTAQQWAAMVAGAASSGLHLEPQGESDGIPSCYRSYDAQVWAKANSSTTAATPGTSNHGLGIAIDINMAAGVLGWLNAHAGEYGFDNVQGQATRPAENWHWVRTRVIAGLSNTITARKAVDEETEMYYKANGGSSNGQIGNGWTYKQLGNGPVVPLTNLESVALAASGTFVASYSGDDILLLAAVYGLAEYQVLPAGNKIWAGRELQGPGKLTGRIIYPGSDLREYPAVQLAK